MNTKATFVLALVLSSVPIDCLIVTVSADETTTNNPVGSGSVVISYKNLNGFNTNETTMLNTTDANVFATAVATNLANLASFAAQTNAGPGADALSAYVSTNQSVTAWTNSAFVAEYLAVVSSAGNFFVDLKNQGRLPGISKGRHGKGASDGLFTSDSWLSQKIKYPFSLTFHIVFTGDTLTNHYTMVLPSKDSSWRLQKAWRTDSKGHVIKEWPVEQP